MTTHQPPAPEHTGPEHSEQSHDHLSVSQLTELATEAAQAYFRVQSPMPYAAGPEEPGFSGDAASLFMLAQDGDAPPRLVKVGWGEYSLPVLQGEKSKYPESSARLAESGFPLYVVTQDESFFANDKLQKQMTEDPRGYLREHAIMRAEGAQAYINTAAQRYSRYGFSPSFPPGTPNYEMPDEDLQPVPMSEVLSRSRDLLVKDKGDPAEFGAWLQSLPDDPAELGRLYADSSAQPAEWQKWANLTYDLGVNRIGIAVGSIEAMKSVLNLKTAFDSETNSFRAA